MNNNTNYNYQNDNVTDFNNDESVGNQNSSNHSGNNGTGGHNNSNGNNGGNSGSNGSYSRPQTVYPKRKSSAAVIIGIILILAGTAHIVDKFLPWVFNWIDSGMVIAAAAIIFGVGLLVKR